MALDEHIRQLLKELGDAINESISSSEDVNDRIQRIRDEGYNLYVVLDATIGLDKNDEDGTPSAELRFADGERNESTTEVQFRINVNDLALLRSLGIDPTRKVRSLKQRLEERTGNSDEDGRAPS